MTQLRVVFETYIGYFEKKCLDEFVMKRFVKYELVVFIIWDIYAFLNSIKNIRMIDLTFH